MKIRIFDNIEAHELSIDTHGFNFLCIFGEHVGGGFISVMNWNVSAEISFNSFGYSCHALALVLYKSSIGDRSVCDEIACDIITAIFELLDSLDSDVEETSEPESEPVLCCPHECPWFDGTTKGCRGCSKLSECVMYEYMKNIENPLSPADQVALERIISDK